MAKLKDIEKAIDILSRQLEETVEARDRIRKDLDAVEGRVRYLRDALMNVRRMAITHE